MASVWEGKKYKSYKEENFQEYLKVIGANMIIRKLASTQSPVIELKKEGDEYTFTTVLTFRTMTLKFKLDEEFDEEGFNGKTFRSTFRLDGNTLIQDQKADPPSHITREFTETECMMTVKKGDLVAKRWYKAVE